MEKTNVLIGVMIFLILIFIASMINGGLKFNYQAGYLYWLKQLVDIIKSPFIQ